MEVANIALLGKAVWSMLHEPNKLWVKVFTNKYLQNSSILQVKPKVSDSPVWKGLLKSRDYLREGFSFKLGNGETSLWRGDWSGSGSIAPTIPFVDIHDVDIVLKDIISNGAWSVQQLYTNLPGEILHNLQKVKPVLDSNGGGDKWIWSSSNTGKYTVKDAYSWSMAPSQQGNIDEQWNWVWKTKIPEKLKMFMWLILHKALQVNAHRYHCKMAPSPNCTRCSGEIEDVLHCLRVCPHARELWSRLGALSWRNFNNMEVKQWLKSQATGSNALKFISGIWWNWKWRNNAIFEDSVWSIDQVWRQMCHEHDDILAAFQVAWVCLITGGLA